MRYKRIQKSVLPPHSDALQHSDRLGPTCSGTKGFGLTCARIGLVRWTIQTTRCSNEREGERG